MIRASYRLLLLAAGFLWVACRPQFTAIADPPVPTAESTQPTEESPWLAAEFSLTSITGEDVSLVDWRGKWVLVNFWATWCGPCVREMPYLQELAQAHEDQLVVLGINMRETNDEVAAFAAEHGLTFPLLMDPDDETLLAYQVLNVPLTVVINPDGEIARRFFGPLDPVEFDEWLAVALAPPT
jgi:thiol-disulfide isomerase/thioredoxin